MKPREPRRKVFINARMRFGGAWRDVCIRDVSSRGLLLQAPTAPARGSYLELYRGRQVIVARVVWSGDGRFGVLAQDRINVDALVTQPERPAGSDAVADRRAQQRGPTAADLDRKADSARHFSRLFGFSCTAAICIGGAIVTFTLVEDLAWTPLRAVSAELIRHETRH